MQTTTQVFTLGQTVRYIIPGRFFRLMEASAGVDIKFYKNQGEVGRADSVKAGFAWSGSVESDTLFDTVEVKSSAAQTVTFVVSTFPVSYDRSAGSVDVLGDVSVIDKGTTLYSRGVVAVGVASVIIRWVPPTARRWMFLQNLGTTTIFVQLDLAATLNAGMKLNPGDSYTFDNNVPQSAVYAISDAVGGLLSAFEGT